LYFSGYQGDESDEEKRKTNTRKTSMTHTRGIAGANP
jgi:hypothetical protein